MKTFRNVLIIALFVLFNSVLFAQNETKSANVIMQRLDSIIYVGSTVKYDYFYNNSGQNIRMIHYNWRNTSMKYEKDYQAEYSFDAMGNCILIFYYITWDMAQNKWINNNKFVQSFDENNELLQVNFFSFNKTSGKWELARKTDYENTYDNKNKLIGIIGYTNSVGSNNILKQKFDYTYNPNGILTSVIYSYWPVSGIYQENYQKDEFIYDTEGKLIARNNNYSTSETSSGWNVAASDEYKYNTTFDSNQLSLPAEKFKTDLITPQGFKANKMITSLVHFTFPSTFKAQQYSVRYYYSAMEVTGIADQEALKTTVYPNPATDFLNIQWNGNQSVLNVELFNVTGMKVFTGMIENNSKLPIKGYPEGLYLVKISDGNKTLKTEKVYFK